MELDYGGDVPARGFTGGDPEVGEKLEGSKAVPLITLARVGVVGKVNLHGRPRRRRRGRRRRRCSDDQRWRRPVTVMTAEEKNTGEHREGQIEAQRSQVKGGELHRVKAKLWEGLSWIGKGWGGLPTLSRARQRRRAAAMVDSKLVVKCECKGERNGGRGSY
jgi:hypothetical protein